MPALTWVDNALLEPSRGQRRGPQGWNINGGVFDAEGREVALARLRYENAVFSPPATLKRDDIAPLPGRWLFGGWLQSIFGHYLVFCMGQLWPLVELDGQIDGVVFHSLEDGDLVARNPALRDILACLGIGTRIPLVVAREPVRVERLAVGEPIRLGLAGAQPGHDEAFMALSRRMAASPLVSDGLVSPGLYVSRSRLVNKGGLLLESMIEENLAAEGYTILYPERLSIAEQLTAYAGARRVIFAESSAVHLAIGAIGPDTPVALIARRRPVTNAVRFYLRGSGLRRVTTVDAIRSVITFGQDGAVSQQARFLGVAVLDHAKVRDGLVEAGFCRGEAWRLPSEEEQRDAVAATLAARQAASPKRNWRDIPVDLLGNGAPRPPAARKPGRGRAAPPRGPGAAAPP